MSRRQSLPISYDPPRTAASHAAARLVPLRVARPVRVPGRDAHRDAGRGQEPWRTQGVAIHAHGTRSVATEWGPVVTLRDTDEVAAMVAAGVAQPYRGELEIWNEAGVVVRVSLYAGRIAWVSCSAHDEHLGDVLGRQANVAPGSLRKAMQYARDHGRRFGEAMVELRIVSAARLREALRVHIQAHIDRAFSQPGPWSARFAPREHAYDPGLTFEPGQLRWSPSSAQPSAVATHVHVRELDVVCRRWIRDHPEIDACAIIDQAGGDFVGLAAVGADEARWRELLSRTYTDVWLRLESLVGGGRPSVPDMRELTLAVGAHNVLLRAAAGGELVVLLVAGSVTNLGAIRVDLRYMTGELDSLMGDA
jgi:hypothetical protein